MRARAAVIAVVAFALVWTAPGAPAAAHGMRDPSVPLVLPRADDVPPPGWRLSPARVLAIAAAQPAVRGELARHPGSYGRAYLERGARRWQASFRVGPADRRSGQPSKEIAQVIVADSSGRVLEAWTGIQVDWVMARGYPGAFGGPVNAPALWLALCALFLLPYGRRPWTLLHLDLAALLAFSVSYACFNAARIELSVPLAYPPLLYLAIRSLVLAVQRSRNRAGPEDPSLVLAVAPRWLAVGLIGLLVGRIALHAASANVIDVGYAGVIGADRLLSGGALYGAFPFDNPHGDTYGPVLYLAYVPFELLAPWSGTWDDLPAAHLAAVAFDGLAVAGLWLLGRRLRGPRLGLLLAWAWVTYPFTLMAANASLNDALVAVLVVSCLLAASSAPARGAAVALAGLTKFAPLLLGPVLATYRGGARPGAFASPGFGRGLLLTAAGAMLAGGLVMAPVLLPGRLDAFWERTLGFQAARDSPFSLWGLYGLDGVRRVAQGAVVGLALGVALWPARRDVVVLAGLGAAVLLAIQLALGHWFYAYLLWGLPLLLVALLAPYAEGAGRRTETTASARRGAEASTTTALSHGSTSEAS